MFEDGPTNFKVLEEHLPNKDTSSAVQEMATASSLSFVHLEDTSFDFFVDIDVFESDTAVIYTDYSGVIALKGMPCQYYLTTHSKFYGALVPVKTVRDIVNEVLEIFTGKYVNACMPCYWYAYLTATVRIQPNGRSACAHAQPEVRLGDCSSGSR